MTRQVEFRKVRKRYCTMTLFSGLTDYNLNILTVFCLASVLSLLYLSALAFYRVFFHPLAKYPGPLLAKVTDLNSTYHAVRGDRHLEFWRCHEKYGPIVRTGPNSLSFNSKAALKEIYGFKANVRKSDFYSAFPATKNAYSTHSAIDKSVHARKRRVLSQAFSDSAIKSMESHMLEHIRSFCANLGLSSFSLGMEEKTQAWTEGKNLSKQADYLTFDIMGDLCFGKAFGMLERPDNRFATHLVSNAAHRHLICGTYLPIHEYHLDKILFRKIASGRARYMQYSKAQAAERTKMGMDAERKDFFYHLLNAKDPETGNGFSTAELWEAKRRSPKLSGLQYLRACIDEAMRMSPSVGGILPRQVLAGGFLVDGEHIPEDTVIGVPHYAIHHSPEYYPEPFTYKPERWIAGSNPSVSPESVAVAQSAFCPFSVGPRGCIGKGMAYVEMTMTIARAVYLYDMRLAPGHNVGEGSPDLEYGRHRRSEFQLKDTFTSVKDGPVIEFRKCR
ncbi:hypothetical protein KC368_g7 [Hortaea werneckii]|nr:hypothetical protein KC368_g7 [Hortaea werneckii]